MLPVFVADRPASLRILSGLDKYQNKFGILAHALTTDNFREQFAAFPLTSLKIGDSGIFQGKELEYKDLFQRYSGMNVSHGIIKDYYRDRAKTLDSAKKALKAHKKGNYDFKLVGVAQGTSVAEYVTSYREQRALGLKIVAIGGLLEKIPNHARMVVVKHDVYLANILRSIRREFPKDYLFPLGSYSKRRLPLFFENNVWISDYKGWIFRYDKNEVERLDNRFEQTRKNIEKDVFSVIEKMERQPFSKEQKHNNQKRMKRLLIIACTKNKKNETDRAINVYDGQTFKKVRKQLRKEKNIDVKIISAKYGLIDKLDKIGPYDLKMTKRLSEIYGEILSDDLRKVISDYEDVFVYGGKYYQSVVPKDQDKKILRSSGKIGQQNQQLKIWLENDKAKTSLYNFQKTST